MSDRKFYLQNSTQFVGNSPLWWRTDGRGYTTDLTEAHMYTELGAMTQHNCRPSDIPWPCDYIDARCRPVVDHQVMSRSQALAGTGIVLKKPEPKPARERYKCEGCGVFMSDSGRYGSPCAKCGTDNRP